MTPQDVIGVTFKTTVVPIANKDGAVIGTIGLGISLENREKLVSLAETVSSSSQEASATFTQLTTSAEQFTKYQSEAEAGRIKILDSLDVLQTGIRCGFP